MIYSTRVNADSRSDMIRYLTNHLRYNTRFVWDHSLTYANDLSVSGLTLGVWESMAHEMVKDGFSMEMIARDYIDAFSDRFNGFTIAFNDGYAVLRQCHFDGNWNRRIISDRGTDEVESFLKWSYDHIQERTQLLCEFDVVCERIRASFFASLLSYSQEKQPLLMLNAIS